VYAAVRSTSRDRRHLCWRPALRGNVRVMKPSQKMHWRLESSLGSSANLACPRRHQSYRPIRRSRRAPCLQSRDSRGFTSLGGTTDVQVSSRCGRLGEGIDMYRPLRGIVGLDRGARTSCWRPLPADAIHLTTALIRGAFEYHDRSCSAASRAYIPRACGARSMPAQVSTSPSCGAADVAQRDTCRGAVSDGASHHRYHRIHRARTTASGRKSSCGKTWTDPGRVRRAHRDRSHDPHHSLCATSSSARSHRLRVPGRLVGAQRMRLVDSTIDLHSPLDLLRFIDSLQQLSVLARPPAPLHQHKPTGAVSNSNHSAAAVPAVPRQRRLRDELAARDCPRSTHQELPGPGMAVHRY